MSLRLIYIIWFWTPSPIIYNIDLVQQGVKLCVGIVQDWITFELAIRIHHVKDSSDISRASKKRLRIASAILFATITLVLIAFVTIVLVSANRQANNGYAFNDNYCFLYEVIGYFFLG